MQPFSWQFYIHAALERFTGLAEKTTNQIKQTTETRPESNRRA